MAVGISRNDYSPFANTYLRLMACISKQNGVACSMGIPITYLYCLQQIDERQHQPYHSQYYLMERMIMNGVTFCRCRCMPVDDGGLGDLSDLIVDDYPPPVFAHVPGPNYQRND